MILYVILFYTIAFNISGLMVCLISNHSISYAHSICVDIMFFLWRCYAYNLLVYYTPCTRHHIYVHDTRMAYSYHTWYGIQQYHFFYWCRPLTAGLRSCSNDMMQLLIQCPFVMVCCYAYFSWKHIIVVRYMIPGIVWYDTDLYRQAFEAALMIWYNCRYDAPLLWYVATLISHENIS